MVCRRIMGFLAFLASATPLLSVSCLASDGFHAPEAAGFAAVQPFWPADQAAPLGLMGLPAGWLAGDAAVVLTPAAAWPRGLRNRLAVALADSGAAVIDLNAPPPGMSVDCLMALAHALLRLEAGIIIAIGPAEAPEARHFTAAIGLGLPAPAPQIRRGPDPPLSEAWPRRAFVLCHLLGRVTGAGGGWIPACEAALLPSG